MRRRMDGEIPDDPETTLAGTAGLAAPSLSGNLPLRATRADIAQFVAVRAAACVGADYSNLALLDRDDATQLRLFHGPSIDPAIVTELLVGSIYFRLLFGGRLDFEFGENLVDALLTGCAAEHR